MTRETARIGVGLFPSNSAGKMAAICTFTNQIECPLHMLQALMPHLSQVKIHPQ